MSSSAAPVPVSSEERIPLLDALRGFALCGILIINIKAFSGLNYALDASPDAVARFGPGVPLVVFLTTLLAEGKFYSIFSFLFGLGFSIQLSRGEGKPAWLRLYARRLWILFLIGIVHAYALWTGDILRFYAILGFALLLFRNMQPNTILAWALVLLLVPIPFYAACYVVAPGFDTDQLVPNALPLETVMHLYATGSYPVILGANLEDTLFGYIYMFFTGRFFKHFAMFLVGLWVGRLRILHHPERHRTLFKRVLWAGLIMGLSGGMVYAAAAWKIRPFSPEGIYWSIAYAIGIHPMAVAYVAGFALLWQRNAWQRLRFRLVPMGRMALTNYLMQTMLALGIYYGYGLGWYGHMSILLTMLLVLPSILLTQMLLSTWWLQHFRYGPMEWIWRQATYQRRLPLRITATPQPA
ncbi:MAG: DUF418 domain-containing protein [Terriglobales bacterium]